ncbi:Organic cation/carnitine transporter [Melia azedarach]|uniref:Organic cation/carnitine transporter n=1 Tax=Melia azedarach TaxID=155640 RepID=A0ACC1X3L6_MELAZ|nr:Organic cation/carnitine transporter [Melia azedarach]
MYRLKLSERSGIISSPHTMADSTPLLSQVPVSAPPDTSSNQDDKSPNVFSLDEIIEQTLGSFGWGQFLQALLVSLAWGFDAQQAFISVFTDALPLWHCTNNTTCKSTSKICEIPRSSWSWDGSASQSIISDWNLECASSFISGFPESSFFAGCLVGALSLATLADSAFGRKNLLLFSCLGMNIAALLTIFSTNVWIYSAFRFATGFGSAPIATCTVVLLTERVGTKWRGRVGVMASFGFGLGFLSLPAIAYISRGSSWKTLYLCTSISGILYCLLAYYFAYESPRWLLVQGREEEAIEILKRLSPRKKDSFDARISSLPKSEEDDDFFSAIKDLFRKRWALQRLLIVMVLSFSLGMMFYGIPLGIGDLGFNNIYLAVTFNALMEFPSYVITFFFLERANRRTSLLAFSMTSGICSIGCAIVHGSDMRGIQIGLELGAYFCVCAAYNVLLIYSMELFPTCVRNTAATMVEQSQVFGAIFSPMLISVSRGKESSSYGVFGAVIICCGFFVACLPETRGQTLCDTMGQQECKTRASTVLF